MNSKILCIFVMAATGSIWASNGFAADVKFTPFITVGVGYTDNVELVDSGEDSDAVMQFIPGFELSVDGNKLDLDLKYQFENYFFLDESDSNDHSHSGNLFGGWEVLKDQFLIEFGANYFQDDANPEGRVNIENFDDPGNQTDVFVYGVSPLWVQRITDNLKAELRTGANVVEYSDEDQAQDAQVETIIEDSERYFANFNLNNSDGLVGRKSFIDIEGNRRLLWALSYEHDETNYDRSRSARFREGKAHAVLRLTRNFALVGIGGHEDNDFSIRSNEDTDGSIWEAGGIVYLGPRVALEYRTGERFFGNTDYARVSVDGKRIEVNMILEEDLSTEATLYGDSVLESEVIETNDLNGRLSNQVKLRKGFNAEFVYKLAKSRWKAEYFENNDKFQISNEEDNERGFRLGMEWDYSSRSKFELTAERSKEQFEDRTTEDETDEYKVTYSNQLNSSLIATLKLIHTDNDQKDSSIRDYERTAGFLSLTKTF